jgi:MICOS complex subunit MIC19
MMRQFSNEVLAQLSSSLTETTPTPEREATLDSHVRTRIREEVARLREQETEVQNEIARALAKENLKTEARIASSGDEEAGRVVVASSASLREDVEEVRRRVERFQKRREELGVQGVEGAREEVARCYRCVVLAFLPTPSLRWAEFGLFAV